MSFNATADDNARLARTLTALRQALPKTAIYTGAAIDPRHHCDWTHHAATAPGAVIQPGAPADLATALRVCNEHGQPVVPQGGMSGLAGGATPTAPTEIALSLDAMDAIECIDTEAATMTVNAGVTLARVQQAAAQAGFCFPLDFAARETCQVGGLIATNAGGMNVIRHGMMRAQVLGLEVALADGRVLSQLSGMLKNNAGIDLKQCFIGAEGTLGVITRAVLRLAPPARSSTTALIGVADYAAAVALLHDLRRTDVPVAAFELMWADFYRLGLGWRRGCADPLSKAWPLYILCQLEADFDPVHDIVAAACARRSIDDYAIAQSPDRAAEFWSIRYATAEFPYRMTPINFDISLPIGVIGRFVAACRAMLTQRWPGHASVNFGHIGDGNLHLTVDADSLSDGDGPARAELAERVYTLTGQFGGSISAEHGIGTLKKPYMHHSVSPVARQLMVDLKHLFDPRGILNPGKLFNRP